MGKRDILDLEAARKMAWSRTLPRDEAPPEQDATRDVPKDPAIDAAMRAADAEQLRELVQWIEEVWAIESFDLQARATVRLAERASRLAFRLMAADAGNTEVRLARLIVRHYPTLRCSTARGAAFALSWLHLDGQELPDLLAEAALLGDAWVHFALQRSAVREDMHVRHPSLGLKLAAVLDGSRSYEARRTAVFWLSSGTFPGAVPSLRRCLREPYLGLRWPALTILLELRNERPGIEAVTAEDVAWLLEDAIAHPPPCEHNERAHLDGSQYDDVLLRAVRELRPAGGDVLLARIVRHDCAHWNKVRDYLDVGWARRALAAGYPEQATALIDEGMRDGSPHVREAAAKALEDLRWEDAEPRLRIACVDPSSVVTDVARAIFEKRSGTAWSGGALDGLPLELLDAEPSSTLVERATVIRALTRASRDAMAEVLLAEAPSREALVLTLLMLGEESIVYSTRRGVPHQDKWGPALVDRWGDAGVRALLWLARRYPFGRGLWTAALTVAVRSRKRALVVDDARALAIELLSMDQPRYDSSALCLLEAAGMKGPSWRAALPAFERSDMWLAARIFGRFRRCPELDAYLIAEAERRFATGDFKHMAPLVETGLARKLPRMAELVRRALDENESEGVKELGSIASQHGVIDADWRREALRHPDSVRFAVAIWHLPHGERASEEEELSLRTALTSTARGGEARIDAAVGLFRTGALRIGDAELSSILDSTPPSLRVPLLEQIGMDAGIDFLWPHAEAILRGEDTAAQMKLLEAFFFALRENGWLERLEPLLETMAEGEPREVIANRLREPSAAMRYWQDPPRPEERRDDHDDAADDDE